MKETFPGVMEMACNTFLTISQNCKEDFIQHHKNDRDTETEPYIYELIRRIPDETYMLKN